MDEDREFDLSDWLLHYEAEETATDLPFSIYDNLEREEQY